MTETKTKNLILMVGPPGSGKSTFSQIYRNGGYTYINQDKQGREHLHLFDMAIMRGENVICDRMNFSKQQRSRYLDIGRAHGYTTTIIVLHESYYTCFNRIMLRENHETIKDEKSARSALNLFFSKYERVEDKEADQIQRIWPEGDKPSAIICDLDGTLCNVEHRRHFVNKPKGEKKDWKGFFEAMDLDTPNQWCVDILKNFAKDHAIVFCSGRPDNFKKQTYTWLERYELSYLHHDAYLYMRPRSDSRQDNIVKETLLDFELLTRFKPYFMIDDRQQVVDMYRSRGYTVLQCDKGDF